MAQWLRALAAFEDDLFFKKKKKTEVIFLAPTLQLLTVSAILGDVTLFSDLCRYHVCMWYTYIHTQASKHSYT